LFCAREPCLPSPFGLPERLGRRDPTCGGDTVELKRRMVTAFAMLLLLGACLPATLDAQVLYGGIVGTVKDSSGAAVPGATVTITNKGTALERTAGTSAEGVYSFTNVQAGSYDVKASLQGFKEFVKSGVPVNVNEVSRVDVAL